MTLINNQLSHQFKEEFKLDDVEKTFFGFLCFDHPEPNYFSRPDDVDLGYVVADLLSLYQVVALGFTAASDTYNKAQQAIAGKGGKTCKPS